MNVVEIFVNGAEQQQALRGLAHAHQRVGPAVLAPLLQLRGHFGVVHVDVDGGRALGIDADVAVRVSVRGPLAHHRRVRLDVAPPVHAGAFLAGLDRDDVVSVFDQRQRAIKEPGVRHRLIPSSDAKN
jgi:hypothetical protein